MIAAISRNPPLPEYRPLSTTRVVTELSDLTEIFQPEVDVVRLVRPVAEDLIRAASDFTREARGESWKTYWGSDSDDFQLASQDLGVPKFLPLRRDLLHLAEILSTLVDADQIGIRLASPAQPMCPAFHRDHVMLRLVVTYRGPGTEFLGEGDLAGNEPPLVPRDVDGVKRGVAGDIVLLKGSAWPGNERRGAVHRSPPRGDNETRIVATLDPLWKSE